MKNFILFIFLFFILSCKKEDTLNKEMKIKTKIDLRDGFEYEPIDGYFSLISDEYFDYNGVNLTLASGFFVNENLINAGSVNICNKSLNRLSDNRYVAYLPLQEIPNNFFQGFATINLNSGESEFQDISESIYFPARFQATTNVGLDDFFYKSHDLTINWTPDDNIDNVYLIVCSEGIPCIYKTLPNTGNCTINSNEFSNLEIGKKVYINLLRGHEDCLNIGSKEVCIRAISRVSTTGHIIQ